MKFFSYNIRNALMREADENNAWPARRKAVAALIKKANPDIVALQEDSEEQCEFLESELGKTYIACRDPAFYEADAAHNTIYVRETLKPVETDAFWIADTNELKLEGSICQRHATYIHFHLKGETFLVVNVHLDHADEPAFKEKEARIFLEKIEKIAGRSPAKTIILGDFNMASDSLACSELKNSGFYDAAEIRGDARGTYTDWNRDLCGSRIDYVWVSSDLKEKVIGYELLDGNYSGADGGKRHSSDHVAVMTEIKI